MNTANDASARKIILQALFSSSRRDTSMRVFAVFDAARDAAVRKWLAQPAAGGSSLYEGQPAPELAAIAPRLVPLRSPTSKVLDEALEAGWSRSWGIFIESRRAGSQLRHHLRRLMMVELENRRRVYFRWYDPRVLRAYLPTCTKEELDVVFGKAITAFSMESDDGEALLRFTRARDGTLERHETALAAAQA